MHVVTVMFHVDSRFVDAFRARMIDNARASRMQEPGCLQFDVCADPMHELMGFPDVWAFEKRWGLS